MYAPMGALRQPGPPPPRDHRERDRDREQEQEHERERDRERERERDREQGRDCDVFCTQYVMLSGSVLNSTAITTAGPHRAGAILNKHMFLVIRQHLQRSKNDNNMVAMPNECTEAAVENSSLMRPAFADAASRASASPKGTPSVLRFLLEEDSARSVVLPSISVKIEPSLTDRCGRKGLPRVREYAGYGLVHHESMVSVLASNTESMLALMVPRSAFSASSIAATKVYVKYIGEAHLRAQAPKDTGLKSAPSRRCGHPKISAFYFKTGVSDLVSMVPRITGKHNRLVTGQLPVSQQRRPQPTFVLGTKKTISVHENNTSRVLVNMINAGIDTKHNLV
ncbi:hypothetical protein B0H13DRAFT_1857614 [Mycena leptocephala]|nr:hypothetical protein B0H13DRAFT_1857614 [Mycena leptocephala]